MPPYTLSRRSFGAALAGAVGLVALGACASTATAESGTTAGAGLFDPAVVHDIDFTFAQADYDAMIDTYLDSGDKKWIEATVVVDGTTFERAGLRLKGNSSLRGLTKGDSTETGNPQNLPWLVRLDKYVDGQNLGGYTEFVVRSNNSASSLNEAVALELLGEAGLATQKSASTRLSVAGGTDVLRLIIENPADKWAADNFTGAGVLYKAEANGDYSYRGDDAASYTDVFDVEAGDEDFAPLTAFLKFLNESDDATFGSELGDHLDTGAFATYLAVQELIKNSDDIDGPGNNSYLRYTTDKDQFTVVAWDHNLAFGGMGGGGGNRGGGDRGGARPEGGGQQRPDQAGRMGGRSNILVTRFNANSTFKAAYEKALTDLKADLYTSGRAAEILRTRAAVLTANATDLISADTVTSEANSIKAYFA
ncbi:CotH kinase family protein [Actinoplanes sp. G11-F43]|uniref:CotH kinase family protein n=1 Tax=Actinoplanes sp. G11-F43 TaxID=3424130 RepID=UPI003D3594B9